MDLPKNGIATVSLPELFVHFCAGTPQVNRNYEEIKKQSESWLIRCFTPTGKDSADSTPSISPADDDKMHKTIRKTDFSYFMSVVVPDTDAVRLRLVCDWGNWVSAVKVVS